MKNKYLYIIFIFIILSAGCDNNRFKVRNIEGINYIHIFKGLHYKINPNIIEHFYSSNYSSKHWTKFYYTINDFTKIRVYIQSEKLPKKKIALINKNFRKEILDYYNIKPKYLIEEKFEEWNKIKHLSFLTHHNETMTITPKDEGWKKGHEWKKMGGYSELEIYFIYRNYLMTYQITFEYLPQVKYKRDVKKRYEENRDKIISIIQNLKTIKTSGLNYIIQTEK